MWIVTTFCYLLLYYCYVFCCQIIDSVGVSNYELCYDWTLNYLTVYADMFCRVESFITTVLCLTDLLFVNFI